MTPTLRPRNAPACSRLTPTETAALLGSARNLRRAHVSGTLQPLLRGKNLALLCHDAQQPEVRLIRRAALELGAHVAQVAVGLNDNSSSAEVGHAARLLSSLYDAVECQGLGSALVRRLADAADIAVYDALASPAHPTALLAWELGGPAHLADSRRYLLQALLLETMT